MSDVTDQAPETSGKLQAGGGYKDSQESLQSLRSGFQDWTRALSDRSVQLSFALMAANWAVFSSTDRLLGNRWATASFLIVVIFLVINLLITRWIAEAHRKRYYYAESNATRWEKEFNQNRGRVDPWPITKSMERWARALREIRTWLPLASGTALVIAILGAHSSPEAKLGPSTGSGLVFLRHGTVGPFVDAEHEKVAVSASGAVDSIATSIQSCFATRELIQLVVVGSADRRMLQGQRAGRYGGDYGLSAARAGWVRGELLRRIGLLDREKVLALSRGPLYGDGLARDREVVVYGLWSLK